MDSSSPENMRSRGGCDPQDAFKPHRELGNLSAALLNIYQPSNHWASKYLAADDFKLWRYCSVAAGCESQLAKMLAKTISSERQTLHYQLNNERNQALSKACWEKSQREKVLCKWYKLSRSDLSDAVAATNSWEAAIVVSRRTVKSKPRP